MKRKCGYEETDETAHGYTACGFAGGCWCIRRVLHLYDQYPVSGSTACGVWPWRYGGSKWFSLRAEELTILSEEEMKAQYGAGSLSYAGIGSVWYLLVTCTFENKSNEEERLPLAQMQLMSFPDTFAMQYESCAAVNGVQSMKDISTVPVGETAKIVFPVAVSERMLPSSKCGEEAIRAAEYRLILTNYPERQEIVLSS